jgi:hypothetical protein
MRRWLDATTAILAAGVLAGTGLTILPSASGPATAAPAATTLVNAESGRCLDVFSINWSPGGTVGTWDCNGGVNQSFVFTDTGDLRAMNSTLCLDTATHPASAGTEIRTATCDGGDGQKFGLKTDGAFVNVLTGLCVAKTSGATANGTRVSLQACDGTATQRWAGGASRGTQTVAAGDAAGIHGVNWADPADNFKSVPIYPSGLTGSEDYATAKAKATPIVQGFKALGANTIRFGINAPTVSSTWWNGYRGVIDAATDNGVKVILGFWNKTASYTLTAAEKTQFYAMWNTVMAEYGNNPLFYANVMNEPVAYGNSWLDFAAEWLNTYSYFPPSHVIIAGTGADYTPSVPCADSRFSGTLLSYHQYTAFGEGYYSADTWKSKVQQRVGACASRTVMTEFGDWTQSGIDFNGPRDGDQHVAYIVAMTESLRELGMGSTYWPGYREGDGFSLTSLTGSGSSAALTVNNTSLLDRIHYAWGQSSYAGGDGIETRTSQFTLGGNCLVVTGQTSTPDALMKISNCNGLTRSYTDITHKVTGQLGIKTMCVAPKTSPAVVGTSVALEPCTSDDSQDWTYDETLGTLVHTASGLCLQGVGGATASGTNTELAACVAGASSQKWTRRF